ncbi:MAG: S8 family serine peptidase [Halolamina sp.]
MSDETDEQTVDRRTVLRAAGVAAGATALGGAVPEGVGAVDASTVDDGFDMSATGRQEAVVVFDARSSMTRLHDLDLSAGVHEYDVLPMTYTALTTEQIETVAGWDEVRRVRENEELTYLNDDVRDVTEVDAVREELGYDGDGVDVAVIDSGFSGPHPDFEDRLESNWQWVDDPLGETDADWTDLGPSADTDSLGHGTHCTGIVGGDGAASDGRYAGVAPGVRLSVYNAAQTVYVAYAVGAWDHLLRRLIDDADDFDPAVVSNSYGVARDVDYNPNDPVNVAAFEAFVRGAVPVFAAGNDGPEADTLSRFAKAPHVLGVGATRDDGRVTGFSSRGRTPEEDRETNYDRATALRNLGRYTAAMTGGNWRLQVGRFEGQPGPTGTGSDYHRVHTDQLADVLDLQLEIRPDGEQISLVVHEDTREGRVVAKLGEEPVYQHRDISVDVDGDRTYWVELEPATNVAVDYEVEWTTEEAVRGEPSDYRPVGLYRPAVVAPGNGVMSTLGPTDPLDAVAPDAEAYYGPLSGTSMATPVVAGICALVVDAAQANGHDPHPAEVIGTVEATAQDRYTAYTPYNAGAGFVDAAAAVRRAEAGDFADPNDVSLVDPDTPTTLAVAGARADDGDVFTGGQTDRVDVTVSALSHGATIRDEIPAEWTVKDAGDVEHVERDGDRKLVTLGRVAAADAGDGATTTLTYFAEAPSDAADTGTYAFGPAAARSTKTDDDWVTFGGTDTNEVVAEDTDAA